MAELDEAKQRMAEVYGRFGEGAETAEDEAYYSGVMDERLLHECKCDRCGPAPRIEVS